MLSIDSVQGQIFFSESFNDGPGATSGTDDVGGVAWTTICPDCLPGGVAGGADDYYKIVSDALQAQDSNGPATFETGNIDISSCTGNIQVTFDLSEHDDLSYVEGDLILCLDEARRQAAARNHTVRQEMLLYGVHGLLHLLGEDDLDEASYQKMHKREDEILTALGVGVVFARDRVAPADKDKDRETGQA